MGYNINSLNDPVDPATGQPVTEPPSWMPDIRFRAYVYRVLLLVFLLATVFGLVQIPEQGSEIIGELLTAVLGLGGSGLAALNTPRK